MFSIIRTNSDNTDFKKLVALLDEDLKITDGDEHAFYDQFNKIDNIKNVVVFYLEKVAVGCGAFKEYNSTTVEIKRMYTHHDYRGRGIASKIVSELESWARELKYQEAILETGTKQIPAIALYQRLDYLVIPNYGQYENVENSVCMRKVL
jgi:putative acetyltransferase